MNIDQAEFSLYFQSLVTELCSYPVGLVQGCPGKGTRLAVITRKKAKLISGSVVIRAAACQHVKKRATVHHSHCHVKPQKSN